MSSIPFKYSTNQEYFYRKIRAAPVKSTPAPRTKPIPRTQTTQKPTENSAPQLQHQISKKPSSINEEEDSELGFYGQVKEDYIKEPFKNPDAAYKDAMAFLATDIWFVSLFIGFY